MCKETADFNMCSFVKSKAVKHFKSASVLGGKCNPVARMKRWQFHIPAHVYYLTVMCRGWRDGGGAAGDKAGQANGCSWRLSFDTCKCHPTGYFPGYSGTNSTLVCRDKMFLFGQEVRQSVAAGCFCFFPFFCHNIVCFYQDLRFL